ncbi:MAG: ferrous iron transport protein B [Clostridia bacterium]|nr:ferrous iron transport protein B [Clostridia bacterium]
MNQVLLIGNPNTGKTTLFNSLTRANEHTGNWHGVTVDSKQKIMRLNNQEFKVVDLPGIYSLSPLSFEESVTVEYLYSHLNSLVVNIVDVNNLHRNLYLTLELLNLNVPCVLVVNDIQNSKNKINKYNLKKLEQILGIKVLKINAENKQEINILKKEILNFKYVKTPFELKQFANINNNKNIELTKEIIKNNVNKISQLNLNYVALKTLENDEIILNKLNLNIDQQNNIKLLQEQSNIETFAKQKFDVIQKILQECKITTNENKTHKTKIDKPYGSSKLDKIVLNKFLCLPIFFAVMLLVFYLTFFSIGAWLSDQLLYLVQDLFGNWILGVVKSVTNNAIIYDFFASALIGGIGSVLAFLPQIVMLFLCLGILEDSGYLSRVAFCLDDIFAKVGLSGKSVYTLLMGFGCSTSACLTARTVNDKNSKIKTSMLAPYMSCSAKLPIYAVIGSAFFGAQNVFVVFALYMLGVVVALLLSVLYEKTFLKSKDNAFIMEFPPYKLTKPKRMARLILDNAKQFLLRVGSLLVSVNVIVWVLSNFSFSFAFVQTQGGQSMLETLGKIFAPIFAPLGFGSWGATSALIAGLIAKEIIVASLAMFNGISNTAQNYHANLSQSLTNPMSAVCFTPASALSYMVFCLLYSPCLATVSVLGKEIGKKWTLVSILVQFAVAYVIALVVNASVNLIMAKGIWLFLLVALVFAVCLFAIVYLLKKILKKRKCHGCSKCN